MGDGVLLSETAFPKDGKEVDGKKEKRVLCGWLGGKHSKVDLKSQEDPRHGVAIYKKLPI